jgi:hypothetical protein
LGQDDAAALSNALDTQLIDAEARRAERSSHPDAMALVFQGRAWSNKGLTPECTLKARGFFEQAAVLDPQNVEAMLGLAGGDVAMGAANMTDDWLARFAAAEAILAKILSLAPNHPRAHLLLGLTTNVPFGPPTPRQLSFSQTRFQNPTLKGRSRLFRRHFAGAGIQFIRSLSGRRNRIVNTASPLFEGPRSSWPSPPSDEMDTHP